MSPVLLFFVTTSPCREWVICAPAAFLGCGSRFSCSKLSNGGRERNEIWRKGSLGDEDDAGTLNARVAQRKCTIPHLITKNNCNVIEWYNNTHQGAPHTGKHCITVTWSSGSGGIQAWSLTTKWFPSVLWHCWFGHLACKNRPQNDLLCVEWDVKPYTLSQPTGDSHKPSGRLPLLFARPAVT